jgi:5-formyltetrahydrofolate cyclo-ligase
MTDIVQAKKTIRKDMREQRLSIPEAKQTKQALAVTQHFIQQFSCDELSKVALYLSYDGEISCYFIMDYLWQIGASVYIPKITPGNDQQAASMDFYAHQPNSPLLANQYGILEPIISDQPAVDAKQLEMIILPLTAVDQSGYRVGLGGGYYDRFLPSAPQAKTIGLAHDFQLVEHCPREPYDQPVDHVITPSKLITFSNS